MRKISLLLTVLFLQTIVLYAQDEIPYYMKGYEKMWKINPKAAAIEWFRDAHFGMFVHFSPASRLPYNSDFSKLDKDWFSRHALANQEKKVMDEYTYKEYLYDKLDFVVPEVQKVIDDFNPKNFNADSIADLAVRAGMKYITFTTQHVCGRLFMFDTSISKCNSVLAYNRDFVKELSDACQKRGLGLFFYVMPPANLLASEIKVMLKELLTNYGPIAGIWFDGIWCAYLRPNDYFETGDIYAYVNEIQPQCLISFKTGFTGDEDFLSPEWHQLKYDENKNLVFTGKVPNADKKMPILRLIDGEKKWVYQSFSEVWEKELRNKPVELSTTMIKGNVWFDQKDGVHKTTEEVLEQYKITRRNGANFLLNVAPRGDGSIHPDDYAALKDFATIVREQRDK